LRALDLSRTAVSDEGMADIAKLEELQTLRLSATRVTDTGLARLKDLHRLDSLDLTGTRVALEAIRAFKMASPKCHVAGP
jgi:hypothetical protein